jgi:5-methylcytosine-specific restriction endonuclease McrA
MEHAEWKRVHEQLSRLARTKGAYDAEEAHWLVEGKRARVHEPLGYGTYFEYLERLFGYTPRLAAEKLRVADALLDLPDLRTALATGTLTWSAVRELTRVAVPSTEQQWIDAARGHTVRDVEQMVSGRRPGDRPEDAADPRAVPRVLRFEVSADTFAAMREARRQLELEVGHVLDDDTALRLLAHRALGGPGDESRAPYQIALTVCDACGRGTSDAAGAEVDIEPSRIEAAECDAQRVGATHVGRPTRATQDIPPRIRRHVWRRDHGRCQVPGCRASKYLEIHHIIPRSRGGSHEPDNLILACNAHHVAVHEGRLAIEGTAPNDLRFAHADGTEYGHRDPVADSVAGEAVLALRGLGYSSTDAKRAVADAPASATLEAIVRYALAALRPALQATGCRESRAGYRPGPATATSGSVAEPSCLLERRDRTFACDRLR